MAKHWRLNPEYLLLIVDRSVYTWLIKMLQRRHLSHDLALVACVDSEFLKNGRIRPSLGWCFLPRAPVVYIPVWFIQQLDVRGKTKI